MDERLAELRHRLGEVSDLRTALSLLDWDQMVMMPRPVRPSGRIGSPRWRGSRMNGSATIGSASSWRTFGTSRSPFPTTRTTPA